MNKKVKQFAGKVYYPEEIQDKTEELLKFSREAQILQDQQSLEDRRQREVEKNARIQFSKNGKKIHAINLIIEYTEAGKKTIPFYDFNFKNGSLLESFLNELKNSGCFDSFTTNPYKSVDNAEFIFTKVNMAALRKISDEYKAKSEANTKIYSHQFIRFENNSLFMQLPDGSEGTIDFKTKRQNNDLIDIFETMFSYWKKLSGLENGWLEVRVTKSMLKDGLEKKGRKDYSDTWIKNTISNIRNTKIKNSSLENLVSIGYFNNKEKSWPFRIKKP